MGTDARLLAAIERYCDGVPRSSADAFDLGPFTIFVSRIPWRYYARPRLGLDLAVTVEDVAAVRERQRAEGVPERFEWIAEMTPSLAGAAEATGLTVTRVPLMALEAAAWAPGAAARRRAGAPAGGRGSRSSAAPTPPSSWRSSSRTAGSRSSPGRPERDALAARGGDVGFLRDRLERRHDRDGRRGGRRRPAGRAAAPSRSAR